jgi:hypothetical protein
MGRFFVKVNMLIPYIRSNVSRKLDYFIQKKNYFDI